MKEITIALVDDTVLTVRCEDFMFDASENTLILNGSQGAHFVANFMNVVWFTATNVSDEEEE